MRRSRPAKPPPKPRRLRATADVYVADDDAPDPRARTADPAAAPPPDVVEELPVGFDDEEISEDAAWTEADRAKWGDLDFGAASGEEEEIEWGDGVEDPWAHLEEEGGAAKARSRASPLGGLDPAEPESALAASQGGDQRRRALG